MTSRTEHNPVRVRIAPSPTGPITVGTAHTALFNWLFARQHDGVFVVRIEDTDVERSQRAFEADIFEGFRWLGLIWDEGPATPHEAEKGTHGPYRQSERLSLYRAHLERLLEEKKAYYCYCTKEELEAEKQACMAQGLPPKYGGHCRGLTAPPRGKDAQALRFKTPEGIVTFKDIVRGKVSFDASLFGDMVIAKSLDEPLYNFAVVVDDALMEISHVIRGEDHLSNTPKQILLVHAFGFRVPLYAHIPLLLAPDRSKLSKRSADVSFLELRERGYLAEAVVNFLALLGWHPKGNEEVLTQAELTHMFDLARVQKGGAIFTLEKLTWLNGEHLKRLRTEELADRLRPFLHRDGIDVPPALLYRAIEIQKDRLKTLAEFVPLSRFFFELPDYDAKLLLWQDRTIGDTLRALEKVERALSALSVDAFSEEAITRALDPVVIEEGRGETLWPLRVAVSGQSTSPNPVLISEALGKEEVLRRLALAQKKLHEAL